MPWKETCIMSQRELFIEDWLSHRFSISELCQRYGIARKTGYKWINRFREQGVNGLADLSRARHTHSNQTPEWIVKRILDLKVRYPNWGPVKIHSSLYRANHSQHWPAPSTIGEILKRHNLVRPKRRRLTTPPQTQPLAHAIEPNDVWSADFKGQFKMGNDRWCYPLTLTDNFSRMLLVCKGLYNTKLPAVQVAYEVAFREYGLPKMIRTDNGWPFACVTLGGLTPLSIWLVRLGIYPERIKAGCPQQNGRHERMHRTLKAEVAKPPKGNLSVQQRALNRFKSQYNEERPHQSLGLWKCPADVYIKSPRPFPNQLPPLEYPSEHEVRKVKSGGYIKLNGQAIYVTRRLLGEYVSLEYVDNRCWLLRFGEMRLGIVDEVVGRVIRPT